MLVKQGGHLFLEGYADPAKCKEWQDVILAHQSEWIDRFDGHVYGNAWYLDIETGVPHIYFARANYANYLISLLKGYSKIMLGVANLLESPTGKPLPIRPRWQNLNQPWVETAVQIFGENMRVEGDIHTDLEGLIPYPEAMFDPNTHSYSAVLSIATPESGGGLSIWEGRQPAEIDMPYPCDSKKRSFDYKVGSLMIVDGFLYHQIHKFDVSERNPWRMTGTIHFLYRGHPYPHWEYWY